MTLYYNKAWWNKERKCWMDEFHILDNVWLCLIAARRTPGCAATVLRNPPFVWNGNDFPQLHAQQSQNIDFEFSKSLESAIAKRWHR